MECQRRSITQPKVARHELPWVARVPSCPKSELIRPPRPSASGSSNRPPNLMDTEFSRDRISKHSRISPPEAIERRLRAPTGVETATPSDGTPERCRLCVINVRICLPFTSAVPTTGVMPFIGAFSQKPQANLCARARNSNRRAWVDGDSASPARTPAPWGDRARRRHRIRRISQRCGGHPVACTLQPASGRLSMRLHRAMPPRFKSPSPTGLPFSAMAAAFDT
jgi:hypothetical protein